MPALPWKSGPSAESPAAVVMVSKLPLAKLSGTSYFLRQTARVRRQLVTAPGLVGFALDAHPLRGEYWTLSAWRSQDDLDAFVRTEPHRTVMGALSGVMGETSFHSWTPEVPGQLPSWSDARMRLTGTA